MKADILILINLKKKILVIKNSLLGIKVEKILLCKN